MSITALTAAMQNVFKKQGYTFSGKPKYVNAAGQKAGIFAGYRKITVGGVTIPLIAEMTTVVSKQHGFALLLVGDKTGFKGALSSYSKMLDSFKAR
jgi:hypothetical protein